MVVTTLVSHSSKLNLNQYGLRRIHLRSLLSSRLNGGTLVLKQVMNHPQYMCNGDSRSLNPLLPKDLSMVGARRKMITKMKSLINNKYQHGHRNKNRKINLFSNNNLFGVAICLRRRSWKRRSNQL